jgi:Family of unknown function (DUF6113)
VGLLGALTGLMGAFVHRSSVPAAGHALPAGLLLALVVTCAFFAAVRRAGRGRRAPAAALAGWSAAALLLSMQRPEGDLVLVADARGYLFLLGGLLSGTAALLWPPATEAARPPG